MFLNLPISWCDSSLYPDIRRPPKAVSPPSTRTTIGNTPCLRSLIEAHPLVPTRILALVPTGNSLVPTSTQTANIPKRPHTVRAYLGPERHLLRHPEEPHAQPVNNLTFPVQRRPLNDRLPHAPPAPITRHRIRRPHRLSHRLRCRHLSRSRVRRSPLYQLVR